MPRCIELLIQYTESCWILQIEARAYIASHDRLDLMPQRREHPRPMQRPMGTKNSRAGATILDNADACSAAEVAEMFELPLDMGQRILHHRRYATLTA